MPRPLHQLYVNISHKLPTRTLFGPSHFMLIWRHPTPVPTHLTISFVRHLAAPHGAARRSQYALDSRVFEPVRELTYAADLQLTVLRSSTGRC